MKSIPTMFSLLMAFSSLILSACGPSKPAPGPTLAVEPGVSLALAEHRAAIISNVRYTLHFDIPGEQSEPIGGKLRVDFDLSDPATHLQLDFRAQKSLIHSVRSNGQDSGYGFEKEHIVVPAAELNTGGNSIEVEFTAGDSSLNRNPEYLYTLFVPDRARTAFPLFDQPDLKAVYQLSLEVPADWAVLSNGALNTEGATTSQAASGRASYKFEPTEPISSYLFSFVAGKFQTVTAKRNGRAMTMLHRETDEAKVARNIEQIFDLHGASIAWMEQYTGIDYPYKKFDFALIPAFQYGGMEHVGAVQYRASSLWLDESPSDEQLLGRAGLIAHETAHMWFGNLVTMRWFNDVWTKEVFANFMAAKIINPSFPDIDHDLSFLVAHYPDAYAVDRTRGANPIRQELGNLSDAGQMYGAIIYDKAPIVMRQLEQLTGEQALREGLAEYLQTFAFANASWPDLINILDKKTGHDLQTWSQVWVNSAGRPEYRWAQGTTGTRELVQFDPAGEGRVWPQTLSGGMDYGLFPAGIQGLEQWNQLESVEKGALLINLYENLLAGAQESAQPYYLALLGLVPQEDNQLLTGLILRQISRINSSFLSPTQRQRNQTLLESTLWQTMGEQTDSSRVKTYFAAFAALASSGEAIEKVRQVWSGEMAIEQLKLAENDYIELAEVLAIRLPEQAEQIISQQLTNTKNPDSRRRLEFIAPALAAQQEQRDSFFYGLANEGNRQTESWVIDALQRLHHPSRIVQAEKYLLPSLELLEEIQVTGDIFFPGAWLSASFANHNSATAVATAEGFLSAHPKYSPQLRMKVLQAVDLPMRANAVLQNQAKN